MLLGGPPLPTARLYFIAVLRNNCASSEA